MIGLGTIANTAAVLIGGAIGLFLKKGIKKSLQDSLLQAMGIAVLFIGIGGTLSQMLVFKDGHLETTGTMLMIFSLLIGTLIGEIINIEAKLERLGEFARKVFHAIKICRCFCNCYACNMYWCYGYYRSTPRWFIW